MIGWFADALQLYWGLLYWNARKTRFRLARGRIPCPCQAPSDSGRAMETGCDASLTLHRPSRFRHVCPLLKQRDDARWVCSVDTPDVRPFWLRAIAAYILTALVIYIVGTAAVFALLRARAYPISYLDIAWPPAWSRFHGIQSRYFAQKANRALARHDPAEAIMALSVSYQLDPANFNVGFALARLTEVGEPALSDRVYLELAREHPERLKDIFPGWYESLLWRADFAAILGLTRQALIADPAHRAAWLHAMFFALRRAPNPKWAAELRDDPHLSDLRPVFELELQTYGSLNPACAALRREPPPNSPEYLDYYRPKRLIELGLAEDALTLLSNGKLNLAPHDALALRLEAFGALGWDTLLRNEALPVLNGRHDEALCEVIWGQLVRRPDPEILDAAFEAQLRQPPISTEQAYSAWAGLLCAAGAGRDFERYAQARAQMRALSHAELRALEPLENFFRGQGASTHIESYLGEVQPLPIDVTYALLERYYQPYHAAP